MRNRKMKVSFVCVTPYIALGLVCVTLSLLASSEAFSMNGVTCKSVESTQLNVWSLPDPSAFTGTKTWYNEYNPTRRRTVYEDDPFNPMNPFGFVGLRDDWSLLPDQDESATDITSTEADQRQLRFPKILNPLRVVIRRLRRLPPPSGRQP